MENIQGPWTPVFLGKQGPGVPATLAGAWGLSLLPGAYGPDLILGAWASVPPPGARALATLPETQRVHVQP